MRLEGLTLKLKYVQHWIDVLGRKRYRVRRQGQKAIELPVNGDPTSPEFLAAYFAAMRGERTADAVAAVTKNGGTGSVRDAIDRYLTSTTFMDGYSPSTRDLRRPIMNRLKEAVGTLPLAQMDRPYIERWLETASTQGAKRTLLLAVKPFMQWAASVHLITSDPTEYIKAKESKGKGHHTWTNEEIAQFRAHHALGTKPRVAIELILAVAARRGDGIALGRQHVKKVPGQGDWLVFTQEKNRKRKPQTVEAPVPAELAAAIDACPSPDTSLTFLTNDHGRPFSNGTFGRWFREQITAAGLPDRCVAHGLRKAACRIMAESECTPHEIMSVSGHRTLKEVVVYTDAVDKRKLAAKARAKVIAGNNTVVPLREASA